ncbi:hypothetical protein ACFYOK_37455 [Microbispora bryophytorum]|uniref:hypothetical protein n=1 Tax=Microbispora bryophytorum TaxID=1460882 RepID=UPI0033EFD49C
MSEPHADELFAAVEVLSADAPVYAPGTARIKTGETGGQDLIVICDQHDDPDNPPATLDLEGCCRDCIFVDARDPAVARQLAALINARAAIAAWLQEWAEGLSNCLSLDHYGHVLAVARALNGGARG